MGSPNCHVCGNGLPADGSGCQECVQPIGQTGSPSSREGNLADAEPEADSDAASPRERWLARAPVWLLFVLVLVGGATVLGIVAVAVTILTRGIIDEIDFSTTAEEAKLATTATLSITEDTTLETDHMGDVVIDADGIVFDCDGHAITGSGEAGVWMSFRTGITVTNCVIEGFDVGVWSFGTQNSVLSHNTVRRAAQQAILLVQSTSNMVIGNAVSGSMIGINLTESHDNTIEGNSVTGTGEKWGIGMLNGSSGNRVEGNTTSRTEAGVLFALDAHDNSVIGNTSSGNAKGFESTNSYANSFIGNTASNNTFAAFWLANTTETTITGNTISRGGFGFVVQQSDQNTFDSNTASETTDWFVFGISEGSSHNTITDNTIAGGGVAFALYIGASNNTITNNEVSNSAKGFHITDRGTIDNAITHNTIQRARDIAIHDQTTSDSGDQGTGNHYQDNTCRDNDTDSVPPSLCDH